MKFYEAQGDIDIANDRCETARAVRSISKPDPSLSTIDKVRWVVENKQYNRVNGLLMDMMTASIIIQVYDALNDANKIKFAAMTVRRMADTAFKLVDRRRS
jgi:hypothetical protein